MLVRKILRERASGSGIATHKGAQGLPVRTTLLVFYHREGTTVSHLTRDRELVVGREGEVGLDIPDPGLSRRHAKFWWDDAGVWVEDLQSTNGTKKNGKAIDRARIAPGDDIAMGPVHVSVHVMSSTDDDLRGFDSHERFLAALEDELTRARTFERSLALIMVRGAKSAYVSQWAQRVQRVLRPVDRVGLYGPTAVLISLPEANLDQAQAIVAEIAAREAPLTCTIALVPGDGAGVEELVAAARAPRRRADDAAAPAIVVKSAAMKEVMETVKRLAASPIAVLVHGETGSGKEVIAHAIHDAGPRRRRPLKTINCGAIPQTLIESVLFGHEQGAFTGAERASPGIFEQANGGTVLLDEIGELTASAQAALLRVLETKRVTRVGGQREIAVDVRVLAATHRDLEAMVAAGQFRQDLLYRINSVTLRIPPLRERVAEIRPLAERFLREAATRGSARTIEPAAIAALEQYRWPGNVRELRNVIERAVVLCETKAIGLDDLPERIRKGQPDEPEPTDPARYRDHVRNFEKDLIVRALERHAGNQTETARALGMPLRTLVHKIHTFGIKKKFDR